MERRIVLGIWLTLLLLSVLTLTVNIQSARTDLQTCEAEASSSIDDLRFTHKRTYHDGKGNREQVRVIDRKIIAFEVDKLKRELGVWEKGRNYNQIIDGHGTGLQPPREEEWSEMASKIYVVESVLLGQTAPSSVDHTIGPWFPPIGNQDGEGSCVAWAVGYYTKTFQEAEEHGWDLSGAEWMGGYCGYPTPAYQNRIFSPDFIYHLINGGVDMGSNFPDAMNLIAFVGACSWEKMPYDPSDHTSWPAEAAWREAPIYRGNNSGYEVMFTNTDEGIANLKSWVASDHLAVIGIDAGQYSALTSNDVWTLDNYAGGGGHANTIVGYDDNIGYVEEGETRHGAFKIANSWGVGWTGDHNNDGCYWISYEAMKQREGSCMFYQDMISYEPELVASFRVDHSTRAQCVITVGVGDDASPIQAKTLNNYIRKGGGPHPFCPNNIIFDITEFKDAVPSVINQSFFMKVWDGSSPPTGTIDFFSIEYYSDYGGGALRCNLTSLDVPVNTKAGDYVCVRVAQHDLSATLDAPLFVKFGDSSLLNATIHNCGLSNESDVELQLLINYSLVDSAVIPELPSGSSYTLSYMWTPTVEASFNITAYVPPVLNESFTANNRDTKFVAVTSFLPVHNLNTSLDYLTIQSAIDASQTSGGHTIFVDSGTYYEHVAVNKAVSLIGENLVNTIIDGNGVGTVVEVTVDNVTLMGFTIRNSGRTDRFPIPSDSGITLDHVKNCSISVNSIIANNYAIELYSSSFNTFSGNNITNNRGGVEVRYSSNNTFSGNNITNNWQGIFLSLSSNNTLRGSKIANNGLNLWIWGWNSSDFVNDVDASNTVNGKPIYYWVDKKDMTVPSDAGYVALVNCTRIIVQNLNLTASNRAGVLLAYTANSTITKNNIANSYYGIRLIWSLNITVSGNKVAASYNMGPGDPVGISVSSSSNITVSGNNITGWYGIKLYSSSHNMVSGNNINACMLMRACISLTGSSDNSISENNLTARGARAIELSSSSNNLVYHNNFLDYAHTGFTINSTNVWDDGYPSGGNYWSDHVKVDLYSGEFQDQLGGDGIVDILCVIDGFNRDNYPLMSPWTNAITAAVEVEPNALNLRSGGGWITAYIELTEGYNASYINVFTILLGDTVPAVADPKYDFVTNSGEYLTDRDGDGFLERMVKFDKAMVTEYITDVLGMEYGNLTLAITGQVAGTSFNGLCTIKVLLLGDVDHDGDVDWVDFGDFALAYGSKGPPQVLVPDPTYNLQADFDLDGDADWVDFGILAENYGKTAS